MCYTEAGHYGTQKHHINKTSKSPLCRLYGGKGGSVQYLVSWCEKLVQVKYKRQCDNVAKKVYRDLYKKNGLEYTEK